MTSLLLWILHSTQPWFSFLYILPTWKIDANFSAKGLSSKLKTVIILGVYFLTFEFLSWIVFPLSFRLWYLYQSKERGKQGVKKK